MSIVTLKRKTQVQYNNMSVGSKTGFSLNGTHRSQGYVGQTMLSRSFPRTPMKGNVAKGHGGCCGKYPQHGIIQSAVTSLNDPTVVKQSVLDTKGMIRTHYRWIWRPQPFSMTKMDNFNNSNPQSNYITALSTNTSKIVDASNVIQQINCNQQKPCPTLPKEARPKVNISSNVVQTRVPGNVVKVGITKPENTNPLIGIASSNVVNISKSQQQYVNKLNSACTGIPLNNILVGGITRVTTNCINKPLVNLNINKTPLIGGTKSF